ncbi:prepilin peptidase, partial [Stenotrophomonas maltophilia]|uniref:prepilin peptidase n=1 Tax=Stenotrophomonas maltophilia TaxID=40324 RepID=UPI0013D9C248
DGCGAALGWRALPFLQLLFGRGRCACCRIRIDRSYSWYAAGTAVLFCLVIGICGTVMGSASAAIAAQLFVVGMPMAVMDFEHQEVDEAIVAVSVGLA